MEKLRDYNKAFKAMKFIAMTSLLGFIGVTAFYYVHYQKIINRQNDKVFVVTDNGTFVAYNKDDRAVTGFEAKYMSKVFFKSMFAHDANTYDTHINDGLSLIDEPSGLMIVETFDKGEVKKNYIRWGSRTEVFLDSVKILNNGLPLKATAYFKQKHIIGSELKTELAIACKYDIVKTHRNDSNPFGLQIANLDFVPYQLTNQIK